MDMRRLVLYAALGLVSYSLWTSWQQDYVIPNGVQVSSSKEINADSNLLPALPNQTNATIATNNPKPIEVSQNQFISVKTDVLSVLIDTKNGDVVNANLLKYPVDATNPDNPITLLYNNNEHRYVANSNLVISHDKSTVPIALNYHTDKQNYVLNSNDKTLKVTLIAQNSDGLEVKKEFIFTSGDYKVQVNYVLNNVNQMPWTGYLNTQLVQTNPTEDSSSLFRVGSYTGASYSVPEKHRYQKLSYKQMSKGNLYENTPGGWVAIQQHYFLSAWIPRTSGNNTLYSRAFDNTYTIGSLSAPITLNASQTQTVSADLYIGPEDTAILKNLAPGLELTVDYGWLWFISSALFSLMKAIHSVVGNWGWAIVLVTVLIKLLFYKLSATSYKSMAGMRKLQPKLQALRERYGDDKVKISQGTMELYRQEKVNPLGGCLPIIIQIPVFIALYWVLLESVELRQAPFIFWIRDLAAPDPYHVLPIIMGVTMMIQQRLNPAPPDPMQAKLMMLLPVFFTVIFWSFPAGLVLYWIVNNSLSILQQWYITRKYSDKPTSKKPVLAIK